MKVTAFFYDHRTAKFRRYGLHFDVIGPANLDAEVPDLLAKRRLLHSAEFVPVMFFDEIVREEIIDRLKKDYSATETAILNALGRGDQSFRLVTFFSGEGHPFAMKQCFTAIIPGVEEPAAPAEATRLALFPLPDTFSQANWS
jgi:hypothetical protein